MLTNPRTVCFYHPVACIISVSVAPLARVIIAITSALLLLRSEALPGCFAAAVFFPGFACLACLTFWDGLAFLRAAFGLAVSGLARLVSATTGGAVLVPAFCSVTGCM